jgi:hypothetical protein
MPISNKIFILIKKLPFQVAFFLENLFLEKSNDFTTLKL